MTDNRPNRSLSANTMALLTNGFLRTKLITYEKLWRDLRDFVYIVMLLYLVQPESSRIFCSKVYKRIGVVFRWFYFPGVLRE